MPVDATAVTSWGFSPASILIMSACLGRKRPRAIHLSTSHTIAGTFSGTPDHDARLRLGTVTASSRARRYAGPEGGRAALR